MVRQQPFGQPHQNAEGQLREAPRRISGTAIPIRLHRHARRGGSRALMELEPSETPVEPQGVTQEKDHQLRFEGHVPTRQPVVVERHARREKTADTVAGHSRMVRPQILRTQIERGQTRPRPGRAKRERHARIPPTPVHSNRTWGRTGR